MPEFIEGAEVSDPFDPRELEKFEREFKDREAAASDPVKQLLVRRRQAYVRVFTEGQREQADIDIVLNDLQYFCKTWVPTYDVKDGQHAEELSKRKEGRREVFNRIKDFSLLDSDALFLKYTNAITQQS